MDFLGIWERINNPDFNVTEFSNIRMEAGTNGFVLTSKQWIEPTLEQLVVLSNMESLNAVFIRQGLSSAERLRQLNQIAITQMRSLIANNEIKRLTEGEN